MVADRDAKPNRLGLHFRPPAPPAGTPAIMTPSPGDTDGPNSVTTTHGIEVAAKAQLLEQRTDPGERGWIYAYQITITNVGERALTLRTRHWVITDANGERREVRGPGVVGEQPRLEPGDHFEYQSMAELPTGWGTMEGSFAFAPDEGDLLEVAVGRFFLAESAANSVLDS